MPCLYKMWHEIRMIDNLIFFVKSTKFLALLVNSRDLLKKEEFGTSCALCLEHLEHRGTGTRVGTVEGLVQWEFRILNTKQNLEKVFESLKSSGNLWRTNEKDLCSTLEVFLIQFSPPTRVAGYIQIAGYR